MLGQKEEKYREAFYQQRTAIAKTFLVGIAWSEGGKILFPNSKFDWQKLEIAMIAGNWQKNWW
ncbi:MAG: hypothetical protein MK289_10875 [Trichodesmium sp. ALOHA_ZT_67]|nr:hypothetical protein [Trichodesmium sp. ALOHA_ZT_67]